jgi:hypothetical protein
MKICGTLLPNGMPCHYHMEDRVVINRKGQQYFLLTNKKLIHQINNMNHDVKLVSHVMRCCDY